MSSKTGKKNTLDIEEDMEFSAREWAVQRVMWVVMALIGLSALLGLFGEGLLSHVTVGSEATPLYMQYERFVRRQGPTEATILLRPTGDQAQFWISRDYLKGMNIESMSPEPDSVQAATDRLLYTFQLEEPNQPITVTMVLEPQRFGVYRGELGTSGGEVERFAQFIYP